ncbi:serine/threonine-protein phosphatase 6 regulatory subunit 3 isoform X3 [Polistes fuscatus]|uniref:serine/threonine-protein phosphatase 6 regulatory subunit 3 isoform X3 n=1 Tax=Polistes fuscatus TaxID=30207 RepID=UPI001CA91015|nr:serine/threonine-protein phosphatase 6 regulatory subunit 3 isoform X3 [Polistes fuscatus]
MFWTNNYVSSPHIEALLNKENVTLHELMDEEDILQECKSQNKKLIEYLVRPDVMEELVMLTTMEPSIDIEERLRYKYPNVACELLTCDVPTLNEKLAGDKTLLNKLYAFIDTDQPLNPLLASFFSKTIGVLVARKSDQNWYSYQFTCLQVIEFLQGQQNCVDLLLQHLETSAIMDLILKLVTQVEGGHLRQNILNWLDSQQLVQRLIKLLSPTSEPTKHANASQLLCDMVIVARENQRTSTEQIKPGPILNTLKSEETVSLLLETILTSEKSESSIVGGIQVLLTLLGQKVNTALNEVDIHGNGSNEDMTDDNEQCINISNATIPYLEQLHKLLLDPPVKAPVKTTAGILDCPLGKTRLHVARLLMALLSTENVKIHEALADLGTFQTLLDLFFKYTWNNFLHTQVQQCLALAINCDYQDNNNIYSNIFVKCRLIERILEAWEKNENKQNKENGIRQGYMGHLINIANNIVLQCEKNNALDTFVKTNLSTECLNKWEILVNTKLVEINKTRAIFLIRPTANMPNSEDTPDRYYLKEMYTDYQGQQMTSTFIDNFGFRDNQFDAGDDSLHSSADEITALAFKRINLADEEMDPRADLFDKICQQKQKAGLEECGGGAEWTDEGDLTFQTVVDKRDWHSKQHHGSSSSDEDDEDPRDMPMEIDTSDEPIPANTTIPEVNPWDVVPSEPLESTGWANFDNFESTLSIENNIAVDNKTYETVTKDIVDAATSLVEKETALENKSVENIGGGDSITVDLVDSTSHLSTEANQNSKASDDSIYSVCTSDKNANPSERTPETREDSKNEYVKNSIENDKTLTENKIVCAVQSTPSDTTLMSKDAK